MFLSTATLIYELTPEQIVLAYFHQLRHGCDNVFPCDIPGCRNSGIAPGAFQDATDAALRAVALALHYRSDSGVCPALPAQLFIADIPAVRRRFESLVAALAAGRALDSAAYDATFRAVLSNRHYFVYIFRSSDRLAIERDLDLDGAALRTLLRVTRENPAVFAPYRAAFPGVVDAIQQAMRITYHDLRGLVLALCFPDFLADERAIGQLAAYIRQSTPPAADYFFAAASRVPELIDVAVSAAQACLNAIATHLFTQIVADVRRFFRSPSELLANLLSFLNFIRTASLGSESPLPPERFLNKELSECMMLTQSLDMMLEQRGRYFAIIHPLPVRMMLLRTEVLVGEDNEPPPRFEITVSRTNIVQEGIEWIGAASQADLGRPMVVAFREETAVDAGGLSREFFRLLCIGLAGMENGMLVRVDSGHYWLNAASRDPHFEALGRMVALAALNCAPLPIRFVPVLYKKLGNYAVHLSDVGFVSPELLAGLLSLQEMGYSIHEVGLFFTAGDHELIPRGASISVSMANIHEYLSFYTDWILNKSIETQFRAFESGFMSVMSQNRAFPLFFYDEYDAIISGLQTVDWESFKTATMYGSGYTKDSQAVKWFWEVFEELDAAERRQFLMFVTGSDRLSSDGTTMTIYRIGDIEMLPVAHTCFTVFALPDYPTKEMLRQKLRIAIDHYEGFGLK
jgi:hypothetical protein